VETGSGNCPDDPADGGALTAAGREPGSAPGAVAVEPAGPEDEVLWPPGVVVVEVLEGEGESTLESEGRSPGEDELVLELVPPVAPRRLLSVFPTDESAPESAPDRLPTEPPGSVVAVVADVVPTVSALVAPPAPLATAGTTVNWLALSRVDPDAGALGVSKVYEEVDAGFDGAPEVEGDVPADEAEVVTAELGRAAAPDEHAAGRICDGADTWTGPEAGEGTSEAAAASDRPGHASGE